MLSSNRSQWSRSYHAAILVAALSGVPLTAGIAQTAQIVSDDQTDIDMPRMDEQNVQPARQILIAAIQQLQGDRQAGNKTAIPTDEIAVIDAQYMVIDAQLAADQTRMPQAPQDVQLVLQARDQVLRAERMVGVAQKKLIGDQATGDANALDEDLALVTTARLRSQQARNQLVAIRAQIHDLQVPTDLE